MNPIDPTTPTTPTRPTRKRPAKKATTDAMVKKFAVEVARLVTELHCENATVLDVRGMNDVTDYVVIATGTSDRQIAALGRQVTELAEKHGLLHFGEESDQRTTWLALDFVDVVVHLFDSATRAHYDLEMMWGDAPKIRWRKTAKK